MTARDRQRSRVYAWEHRVVAPRDLSQIPFPAAQGMVDAIWSEMACSTRRGWNPSLPRLGPGSPMPIVSPSACPH